MISKTSLAAIASVAAFFAASANGLSTKGYAVYANGKEIAFIESVDDLNGITEEFDSKIRDEYGIDADIGGKITVTERIEPKSSITEGEELKKNLSRLSDFMQEGYTLIINDKETITFSGYSDMIKALSAYKARFMIDECESSFAEKTEYKKEYVTAAKISSVDDALKEIGDKKLLNVEGKANIEYHSTIDFKTKEEKDETMYAGSREVVCEGIPGDSIVSAEVSYLNGEEVSRKIIKTKVVSAPIDEIVKTGTLQPPGGQAIGIFSLPVSGKLTSGFGQRWGRMHTGIDLAVPEGTPVAASDGGEVIFAAYSGSYGNLVKVDHKNGYITYYAHCSSLLVNVGDKVQKGGIVALSGNTGNSTGPHCHFEIRYNNQPLNPLEYAN